MKYFAKTYLIIIALFIFSTCNNNEELKQSKQKEALNTNKIDATRKNRIKEIDSLRNTISLLKNKKTYLYSENKTELLEAEIKNILSNSNFDHVILGANDLDIISKLFENKFGFSIKKGKQHSNGISNNFIEFNNSTEIEFISVTNPTNKLSKKYASLISNGKYGLEFALRTNNLLELKSNFSELQYDYYNFDENEVYSTLASSEYQQNLPLFFIQYKNTNVNRITEHSNGVIGISSLWFYTNNISRTANLLTEFGFVALRLIKIPSIEEKSVLFKNKNFEIILIESDMNEISGITLELNDIGQIKNILNENEIKIYISQNNERGRSIILDSKITKTICIEFLEKNN